MLGDEVGIADCLRPTIVGFRQDELGVFAAAESCERTFGSDCAGECVGSSPWLLTRDGVYIARGPLGGDDASIARGAVGGGTCSINLDEAF